MRNSSELAKLICELLPLHSFLVMLCLLMEKRLSTSCIHLYLIYVKPSYILCMLFDSMLSCFKFHSSSLIIFITTGTWSSIVCTGTRPPPCSAFTLTMIDNHRAVLFGGWQGGHRSNDAYILDMSIMVRGS